MSHEWKTTGEEWVKALRSGKYEQGTGYLRSTDDKFCCLGVLTDMEFPDGWDSSGHSWSACISGVEIHTSIRHEDQPAFLNGTFSDADYDGSPIIALIDMNDTGSTFEQIADRIEQEIAKVAA